MLADPKSGPKRTTALTALLLILLLVVSSLGVYEYAVVRSLQSQNASVSSADSSLAANLSAESNAYTSLESSYVADVNTSEVVQAFDSHISHIDEVNATAVTADYTSNATIIWWGDTFGLGGAYKGPSDIGFLWQVFLDVKNITATASAVNATRLLSQTVILKAALLFQGYNTMVGNFNITTSGTYSYFFQYGQGQIVRESTFFVQGTTQRSCGAGGPCPP